MKIYSVDHTYPKGPGPTSTRYLLPTRKLAEDYQRENGGELLEHTIEPDSDEAKAMREAWPEHMRTLDAALADLDAFLAAGKN